ncbi:MAG: phospho-N-acetylmuramoyl-pentapeptide-transferase, partial [Candidatus Kapaibacteriota bacterium]
LGGLVGAFALVTGTALFLPLIALIPVIETLSVIIQVISFKLFKKRFFKVSPLHHHFERKNIHESKIVTRFFIVGVMLAIITMTTFKIR